MVHHGIWNFFKTLDVGKVFIISPFGDDIIDNSLAPHLSMCNLIFKQENVMWGDLR